MNGRGTILIALAAIGAGGCAWLPRSDSLASDVTEAGVWPSRSRDAVWFAARRPGLSAVAKDYLFAGPMTVNRDGSRDRYLWFAVGTTIDRHLTGAPKPELETVVLLVDGTPMTFDLNAWDDGTASSPYALSVGRYVSYAARVTGSQLGELANADALEAYVTDSNGRSPKYVVVRGDPAEWRSFGGGQSATSQR